MVKRLIYAYLIGLAACSISVSIANRPSGGRWNLLFAASLGIASTIAAFLAQQPMAAIAIIPAVALLSSVFVVAEILRSKDSWLRWVGYGCWLVLTVALFWLVAPPNI